MKAQKWQNKRKNRETLDEPRVSFYNVKKKKKNVDEDSRIYFKVKESQGW